MIYLKFFHQIVRQSERNSTQLNSHFSIECCVNKKTKGMGSEEKANIFLVILSEIYVEIIALQKTIEIMGKPLFSMRNLCIRFGGNAN